MKVTLENKKKSQEHGAPDLLLLVQGDIVTSKTKLIPGGFNFGILQGKFRDTFRRPYSFTDSTTTDPDIEIPDFASFVDYAHIKCPVFDGHILVTATSKNKIQIYN